MVRMETTSLATDRRFTCGSCGPTVTFTRQEREAHFDATGHGDRRRSAAREAQRRQTRPMVGHRPTLPAVDPSPAIGNRRVNDDHPAQQGNRGQASAAAVKFLGDLLRERKGIEAADALAAEMERRSNTGGLTWDWVSPSIDAAKAMPRPARKAEASGNSQADLLDAIPAGRYLVGDTFIRVDRPEKGRWAGFIFVKRAAHPDAEGVRFAIKNPNARTVKVDEGYAHLIEALLADPKKAATEYGHRTGSCCVCARTLTDPESIKAGIGPICASKF